MWDLPRKFRTVLFPAAAHSDRDLKIDMVEQGFHALEEGGMFITLSEYEKDVQVAKWHKKVFGKCGESPSSIFVHEPAALSTNADHWLPMMCVSFTSQPPASRGVSSTITRLVSGRLSRVPHVNTSSRGRSTSASSARHIAT